MSSRFIVKLAHGQSDLCKLNDVWESVYKDEMGWFSGENQRKIYDDDFHSQSEYLMATLDDEVVATMRIVHKRNSLLPVEEFVDIGGVVSEKGANIIECQRLVVAKNKRGKKIKEAPFGIWSSFMAATLQYCLKNSVGYMLADCFVDTPTTPINSLLKIGFKHTGREFVDTELQCESKSTLLVLDVRDMLKFAYSNKSKFCKFLVSHNKCIEI